MNDIWSWLYEIGTDDQVATVSDLVNRLLDANRAQDSAAVASIGEELIQQGDALNQPWLGVFARHWQLQHRLNDLSEGTTAVADAVSAFEIAHRDENLGCPQTICSAQDLCIAYSRADGPGHADAVIAACEDTLARIDPTWPCYDCVSTELFRGQLHAGRLSDGLETIVTTEVEIRRHGGTPALPYVSSRLEALLGLERDDEALALATTFDEARYEVHSEWATIELQHHQARAHLRAGDRERAVALFEAADDPLEEPALAASWLAVADELVTAGAIENDDRLSATAVRLARLLHRRGTLRTAFDIACFAGRAAAQRGAVGSARRCRELAATIRTELVDPAMVEVQIDTLDAAIADAPDDVADTAPLDQLVAELEARAETEGLDPQQIDQLTEHLVWQGWDDAAESLRRDAFERDPSPDTGGRLLEILLRQGDHEAVGSLAPRLEEIDPSLADWANARVAANERRWSDVTEHCATIVERDPQAQNTRRLWAAAARELGDAGTAARLATELLDMWDGPEPSPDLWLAIVAGTLADDWALVRRAAGVVGFELSSDDGPIEEFWESCLITLRDDNGQERTMQAQRTGPATARVVQVALPHDTQRVGDVIVFEPTPLDPPPDDPEAARFTMVRYPAIVTVERGKFSAFPIEGPTPSEEQWPTLRDAIYEAGFAIWAYDGGTYTLNGAEVPYLYAVSACPPDRSPRDLHRLIDTVTAGWEPPPLFRSLAEAVGEAVDEQQRREEHLWG